MALLFHPKPGTILICDFSQGFQKPEMVKRRPVVVISPKLRRRNGLCTIVPLSSKAPLVEEQYHYKLTLERPLPKPFDNPEPWVKCDMLNTVSYNRLSLIGLPKHRSTGKRKYLQIKIPQDDLDSIYKCILHAIGQNNKKP